MDKIRLLIFRWGNEEYGVPVESIDGVYPMWYGKSSHCQKEIFEGESELHKQVLLMQADHVAVSLVVDQVIRMMDLDYGSQLPGINVGVFRIWHIRP